MLGYIQSWILPGSLAKYKCNIQDIQGSPDRNCIAGSKIDQSLGTWTLRILDPGSFGILGRSARGVDDLATSLTTPFTGDTRRESVSE